MFVTNHGGGCCGISHILEFEGPIAAWNRRTGDKRTKTFNEQLKVLRAIVKQESPLNGGEETRLVEAVLTEFQLFGSGVDGSEESRMSGWAHILKEVGFKEVNRFKNFNSGNWVRVFHYLATDDPSRVVEEEEEEDDPPVTGCYCDDCEAARRA